MPNNSTEIKTDFGRVIFNSALVGQDSLESIINYLELSYQLTDKYLKIDDERNLTCILRFSEKRISKAFPYRNLVIYYFPDKIFPPFIHEYIHYRIGAFNETWFTEGFATYLSLKIKDEYSELNNFRDVNDNWFGYSNKKSTVLCDISDLVRKYKQEDLMRIFSPNQSRIELNSLTKKIEYYRIAASFCEFDLPPRSGTVLICYLYNILSLLLYVFFLFASFSFLCQTNKFLWITMPLLHR